MIIGINFTPIWTDSLPFDWQKWRGGGGGDNPGAVQGIIVWLFYNKTLEKAPHGIHSSILTYFFL